MAGCLSRWLLAASLASVGTAGALGWTRAGESLPGEAPGETAVVSAPVVMPFRPAYRSRPAREPAPAPVAAPGEPRLVETPGEAAGDDDAGAQPAAEQPALPGTEDGDRPAAPDEDALDETPAAADQEDEGESAAPPPSSPPRRELSPVVQALRDRVRSTLDFHRRQMLSARENTATEIMAACLAFGCDTSILRADQPNRTINGITHLCWNYPCDGFVPLVVADGHASARVGYGLQEHPSQLLAVLALSRVKPDYPIRVGEEMRSVADLAEGEKLRCQSGRDLSLTLVGLAYYADDDSTWHNLDGQEWSVERVIREELAQPVVTATDGGLNRLMGLSYAVHRRKKREEPLSGQYRRAESFIREFQGYALELQNGDGSWGPWFLAAKGASRDPVKNLRGTGHVLEWLALSLPVDELEDPRMVRAVEYLVQTLSSRRYRAGARRLSTQEIDTVMHALHALSIYDERLFRPADPPPQPEGESGEESEKVARRPQR